MSAQCESRPDSGIDLEQHSEGNVVVAKVFSPRSAEPKEFKWSESTTVGQAADDVAKEFGYAAGNPTLQDLKGKVFNRDETLAQADVHGRTELELTDKGGGV